MDVHMRVCTRVRMVMCTSAHICLRILRSGIIIVLFIKKSYRFYRIIYNFLFEELLFKSKYVTLYMFIFSRREIGAWRR